MEIHCWVGLRYRASRPEAPRTGRRLTTERSAEVAASTTQNGGRTTSAPPTATVQTDSSPPLDID
jgi:hypothetical protein